MGSFLFLRSNAFNMVEGFDEHTFLFAEEMILSERMLQAGYKCYFFNELTVVHEHGATRKNTNSVINSFKWSFESCLYYCKEYRNVSLIIAAIAKMHFACFLLLYRIKHSVWKDK